MKQRGYTLVELLCVLAILAVLATMSLPLAEMRAQRSRERELQRSLWEIRDALDAYHAARVSGAVTVADASGAPASAYPPDLSALTRLYADARADHRGESLRFLRRVPRDPFADASLPAEQTWGLRSFASEADHPKAGSDVYDVYSLAPGSGLNGVPLAQW